MPRHMDAPSLADGAEGQSVTTDRLSEPILDALDDGEQPHHLILGKSCDIETNSSGDVERVYAAVDADAAAVATDKRILFVVPQVGSERTSSLPYEDIDRVDVTAQSPPVLSVRTREAEYSFNVRSDETPDPLADYAATRRADVQARGPTTTTDGGGETSPLETVTSVPSEGDGSDRNANIDVDASVASDPEAPDGARMTRGGAPDENRSDGGASADAPAAQNGDPDDATGAGDPSDAGAGADAEADSDPEPDPLDTLERLSDLHEKGILNDEEFERKKAELLDKL